VRPEEKRCQRCEKKFEVGQPLVPVYEYAEYGDREFVHQTMRFAHLDCETAR
jgi:hypothetical protein